MPFRKRPRSFPVARTQARPYASFAARSIQAPIASRSLTVAEHSGGRGFELSRAPGLEHLVGDLAIRIVVDVERGAAEHGDRSREARAQQATRGAVNDRERHA